MYIGQSVYADEFNGRGTIIDVMPYDDGDVETWYKVEYDYENGIAYKRSFFPQSSLRRAQ